MTPPAPQIDPTVPFHDTPCVLFAVRVPSALSIHHDRRVKVKSVSSVCLFGLSLCVVFVSESVLRSVLP